MFGEFSEERRQQDMTLWSWQLEECAGVSAFSPFWSVVLVLECERERGRERGGEERE